MKRKFGDTHGGFSHRDLEALSLLKNDPAVKAKAETAKKRFHDAYMGWMRAQLCVLDAKIALAGVLEEAETSLPVWLSLDQFIADKRMDGHNLDEFDAFMKTFRGPR